MRTQLVNINSVKIQNRKLVFKELITRGLTTRLEVARKTNLSAATVSSIVEDFVKLGVTFESKDEKSTIGRKPNLLKFTPEKKKIISIDLSSKNFLYVIKDISLVTESSSSFTYRTALTYIENIKLFCEEIRSAIELLDSDCELIGIGVSVPGPYNQQKDSVVNCLIPEIEALHLQRVLSALLPMTSIIIDHDVKLAAMAEMQRIDDAADKSIFFIYLGEGVGGASAAGNQIYEGSNHFAGDIGQIIITHSEGLNLEQLVSWGSFVSRVEARDQAMSSDQAVNGSYVDRFHAGEPIIMAELTQIADWLATALNNIAWFYDPHMIIIGGHYNCFGDKFIAMIAQHLKDRLLKDLFDNLTIKYSFYDEKSSLVGAANLVREYWIEKV